MVPTIGVAAVSAMLLGSWFGVEGNGRIKEEARQTGEFSGVAVGGGANVDVRVGKERKVTVTTDENLLPLIETKVEGGVLHIKPTKSLRPSKSVNIVIVTPKLDRLQASGGVKMNANVAPSDAFDIEASGGAEMNVRGIDAKKVSLELSGGVDANLFGRADQADYEASGGVDLDASELQVKVAQIDASGGVDAKLHVTESLKGDASGGVGVKVKGRPKVDVDTSGAASVRSE